MDRCVPGILFLIYKETLVVKVWIAKMEVREFIVRDFVRKFQLLKLQKGFYIWWFQFSSWPEETRNQSYPAVLLTLLGYISLCL